jgi:hypothetical protein
MQQKEVLQRIEEVAPSLLTTFASFIHHCTLCIWNKTTVANLITALSEPEIPPPSRAVARILLKGLASSHPKLFKDVVPALADWIIAEAAKVSPNRSNEDKEAVEDILKALSRLSDLDLTGKQGREFIEALKTFALNGETEKQGRQSTTVLLKLKRRNVYADDLVNVFPFNWSLIAGNCSIAEF